MSLWFDPTVSRTHDLPHTNHYTNDAVHNSIKNIQKERKWYYSTSMTTRTTGWDVQFGVVRQILTYVLLEDY
jgi:hypothetical protein